MMPERMQSRRFELKYRIDETTAAVVRDFVRGHLVPDDFGADAAVPSYPVHSLYLDSPALDLVHSTLNGDRNRFKLRIRYYAEDPASPVYFEIKRRVDRCILKQRARVRRECVADLIAGEPPAFAHLAAPEARQLSALQDFCRLHHRLAAGPSAHVAYDREAWINPEHNSVRVTMDRRVRCELQCDAVLSTGFRAPTPVFGDTVILELKFTNRYPEWFLHLVERHNLTPESAAKYVDGVATISAPHLASIPARRPLPGLFPSFVAA